MSVLGLPRERPESVAHEALDRHDDENHGFQEDVHSWHLKETLMVEGDEEGYLKQGEIEEDLLVLDKDQAQAIPPSCGHLLDQLIADFESLVLLLASLTLWNLFILYLGLNLCLLGEAKVDE